MVRALALLKKASATVNREFGLDSQLADTICKAADEVYYLFNYLLLATCLLTQMPAYLPACLPTCLLTWLPAYLAACLLACISVYQIEL